MGRTGDGYVFSDFWNEWTYLIEDDDTPSVITVDAPASVTEGDEVLYTLTRTLGTGQSRAALTVNLRLEQTGDYVSWPQGLQPDTDGRYTIPVTFPAGRGTTILSLAMVDDDVSEANGLASAVVLPSSDGRYTVGTNVPQETILRDNELPVVSLAPVNAEVTEGNTAQYTFTRLGDTSGTTRVGLYVFGHGKMMTAATKAIAATSERSINPLSINGVRVDYILEFVAGETEKVFTLTTAADNLNEGDGLLTVSVLQRGSTPFRIDGPRRAEVLVKDDDIPTVTILMPTVPSGVTLSDSGDIWEGSIEEGQPISVRLQCTGEYEFLPARRALIIQTDWFHEMNHPGLYGGVYSFGHGRLGYNATGTGIIWNCAEREVASPLPVGTRYVGPDGGEVRIKLVPVNTQPADRHRALTDAYDAAVAEARRTGILITQRGLFPQTSYYLTNLCTESRFCPQYNIGTPNAIRITVLNRDPTVLIKAESATVVEGVPARFIVERRWNEDLLQNSTPASETVVTLHASQNGQYITGALPTAITFGRNETSKIIELATVDDSAFGANGSVTIELLPDTTGADLNIAGKYSIHEYWLEHTPEGARSDRATIAITNNDTKPGITIAPASAAEGNGGTTTTVRFTVSLARAVNGSVEVHWATSDGTAVAGQDYTAATSTVTIPRGATSATFSVTITGDNNDEPDETFNVTISMPGSLAAILGGDTATVTGTIIDDDPVMVTIAANKATVEEGEDAVFTLTRSGGTSEELLLTFPFRGTGSQEALNATFEPGSSTAEVSHTTVDDAFVNYPPERQYEAVLLGDSLGAGNVDDEIWSPGTPASAAVTVTDNDELATVTVHPEQVFATERGPIRAIFRRTGGNISQPLVIDYLQFFLRNDAETDFGMFESITFAAGQSEVTSSDFTEGLLPGDSIINGVPESGDLYVPWTLTTVIYGDGGPNGFHRSWEAGIPNTASTVLYDDDAIQGLELHAQYSHRASIGDQVSITFTVSNTGTAASGNPITITSVQRDDSSTTLDGQSDSRVGCTINRAIAVGASRSCTATFTVGQADFDTTPLELDATANDGTASSKPFRIYIKILDGILVGFRETEALQVREGAASTADLVVTREGSLQEEVQVAYITRPFEGFNPGTAIEGDDYADRSATAGIITFGANQAEATISFDILQDGLFESRERFEVVLQPPDGVVVPEGKGIRRVVILDFGGVDYRPVATLHRIGEGPVMEDSGSVEFAVRLTYAARQLLRYDVSLDPGVRGARAGSDFADPTMTVAVDPGETERTFTVALIDDNEVEDPEDFRVRMTGHVMNPNPSWATLATPTTARVTIVDDDLVEPSEVRLTLTWGRNNNRSAITEATNEDITVTASFHIETPVGTSRTFVPFTEDTTVNVQFDPTSTSDPTDFQDFGVLEVVIPAGATRGSSILQFRPVDDDIDEENEIVTLSGSVVANNSVDSSLSVVTASLGLWDNDTRGITVTPGFAMNLMEESDPGTYTVVLDSQPTDTVTIELQLDENGHLNVSTTTLTFNSTNWNVPQTVTVWVEDDGIIEVNQSESIEHEVSGGDYDQVALGSVQVSIADTTVAYIYLEGARALESSGHVEFTIRISPPQPTSAVTVQYSTADGTATGGSDYTSFNGSTLSIPLGQSSSTIRIPITNDTLDEADVETFTLQLTLPSSAKLAGDVEELTATGSIVDDDHTPVLTISGPDGYLSHVPEEAGVPVTFTLTLSGGSGEDVTLDYATGLARGDLGARTGQGTATEGDDYIAVTGVATFLPGEKTKTITVQVQDDFISEGTEFFGLNLSNLLNAEFTSQRAEESASVGILDNDTRGVVISPSQIALEEPRQGATATSDSYSVVLTSQPTATATVAVDGANDPAVSLDTTSLTFTALDWSTPQTVTITPVRDADAVDEFVTVSHTVTGGDYEGLRADDVGVRVDDTDARDVIVSQPTITLTEGTDVTYTVELGSQPIATTTVSISVAGDAQLTIDPTELTFTTSSWNTPQPITVTATQDGDTSNNTATLTHVASGSDYVSVTKTVAVTVTDDDTAVSVRFGLGAYSVAEGASVSVTVTLSEAPERVLAVPIVVVSTVGATSGDYTVMPMSVSFAASETSKTLTFSAAGDGDDDDDESVVLGFDVSGLPGVSTGSPAETTVSIDDDAADVPDVSVRFGSGAYSVAEGASVSVTVTLSEAPERVLAVPIVVVSTVGATSGDYTVMPMSVSFAASETSKTLTFSAAGDGDDDDDESVVLGFDVSGLPGVSTGSPAETTVSIDDDAADVPDVSVRFGSGAYSVAEGASVSVTVTLSEAPERVLAVPIVVVSTVGATSGDYTVMPMSVSFAASETSKTLTFSAAGDGDDDDDESVVLGFDVSGLSGVSTGSPAETTVSIDDDAADVPDVSVRFGSGAYSVAEGASVSVTVTLSEAPERVLAVPIVVVSTVGATSGDYTVMPMSVSFAASETSKTLTFSAAGDGDDDDDESVVLGFDVSGL